MRRRSCRPGRPGPIGAGGVAEGSVGRDVPGISAGGIADGAPGRHQSLNQFGQVVHGCSPRFEMRYFDPLTAQSRLEVNAVLLDVLSRDSTPDASRRPPYGIVVFRHLAARDDEVLCPVSLAADIDEQIQVRIRRDEFGIGKDPVVGAAIGGDLNRVCTLTQIIGDQQVHSGSRSHCRGDDESSPGKFCRTKEDASHSRHILL